MNKTLTVAAALAALCALPAVTADVDATVEAASCGYQPDPLVESPPWLEPRVTVSGCGVSVQAPQNIVDGCPQVGPFVWLHPYIRLDNDCSLTIRY